MKYESKMLAIMSVRPEEWMQREFLLELLGSGDMDKKRAALEELIVKGYFKCEGDKVCLVKSMTPEWNDDFERYVAEALENLIMYTDVHSHKFWASVLWNVIKDKEQYADLNLILSLRNNRTLLKQYMDAKKINAEQNLIFFMKKSPGELEWGLFSLDTKEERILWSGSFDSNEKYDPYVTLEFLHMAREDVVQIPAFVKNTVVRVIAPYFARNNGRIKELHFEDSSQIGYIGKEAFMNNYQMNGTLYFPNTLLLIDKEAFRDTGIEKVYWPKELIRIGESAFKYCFSLQSIGVFPYGIEEIGEACFDGCSHLGGTICIPETVNRIRAFSFSGTGIKRVILPGNLEEIEEYAFSMSGLKDCFIPPNIKRIRAKAFLFCTELYIDQVFPKTIKYEENSFSGVAYMRDEEEKKKEKENAGEDDDQEDDELEDEDDEEDEVYNTCWRDVEIGIPYEIIKAEEPENVNAYRYSDLLRSRKRTYKERYYRYFYNGRLKKKYEKIGMYCFFNNPYVRRVNLSNGYLKKICDYAFAHSGISELILPNTVETIGAIAFAYCGALKRVVFPENALLEEIGECAFYEANMEGCVSFPKSVKSIGHSSFARCKKIRSVEFSEGLENIGNAAFSDCSGLKDQEMILPKSLKEIGFSAFFGCKIKKITFLNTETVIKKRISRDHTVIAGHNGSTAQKYAEENGLPFEAL